MANVSDAEHEKPRRGGRLCIATVTNDLVTDQRMQRICSALAENYDEVWLIGRKSATALPTDWPFKPLRLPCLFNKGFLFYAEMNLRLWWLLARKLSDTVWAVDLDTLPAAVLARPFNRSRVIYDAHEYFVESPEIVNRPLVKLFWSFLAHVFIPKAYKCVTVGPQLARVMESVYKRPFIVIRNVPIPVFEQYRVRSVTQPPILIYQGALNIGRGLEQLISSLDLLPGVRLWIVGRGDIEDRLRQLAVPYGERIVFWGLQPPPALSELTQQATIGLNLLANLGLSYYYSLANKAFDYLQVGLPAIHMNFPEYAMFESAALLINDLQPQTIADAVKVLLQPDVYAVKSAGALALAAQHHWHAEKQIINRVIY